MASYSKLQIFQCLSGIKMSVSSIKSDSTWLEVYVFANGLHLSSQVTIGTYVYVFASKNIRVLVVEHSRVVHYTSSYPYA